MRTCLSQSAHQARSTCMIGGLVEGKGKRWRGRENVRRGQKDRRLYERTLHLDLRNFRMRVRSLSCLFRPHPLPANPSPSLSPPDLPTQFAIRDQTLTLHLSSSNDITFCTNRSFSVCVPANANPCREEIILGGNFR